MKFNRAGTLIATCADDFVVKIFNAITFQEIRELKMENAIKNIAFMNREDKIIISNSLGSFEIHEIYTLEPKPFFSYVNQDKRILSTAISYGDKYLAMLTDSFTDDSNHIKCNVYQIKNLYHDDTNTFLETSN